MRERTATPEETEGLGARLAAARALSPGALTVVYLQGELGAGKTTFARGFARAAGLAGVLRSPTYTLLEVYPLAAGTLVHVDLYRVQSPAELESLGLRDFLLPGHVWLLEWPEHGAGCLPAADVLVILTTEVSGHDVELKPVSPLGESLLIHAPVETRVQRP
jgi:tRNA threonylcarbamoyladenosine biosynthesis protein TsaE